MPPQIPIEIIPDDQKKKIFEQCSSEACTAAKERMAIARANFEAACGKKREAASIRDMWAAVGFSLLTVAGIIASVAAPQLPAPWAIVVLVIAGIVALAGAVCLAVAAGWAVEVGRQITRMEGFRTDFINAAAEARAACSEYCLGDQTVPSCA